MDQAFNGAHHCVSRQGAAQTVHVSYRSSESTSASDTELGCRPTWPPKVTEPLQSKSGDLYLAL